MTAKPAIVELGHTGLWVHDLEPMVAFYTEILGLQVTDRDDEIGIVFLSSRPEVEHHELVLQLGRVAPADVRLVHQISWRAPSFDAFRAYFARFREHGVPIQQVVTHGNAFGIYFFDPEGNRNEVYWQTGTAVQQPFRKSLDLDQPVEAILNQAEELLADDGPAYRPVS